MPALKVIVVVGIALAGALAALGCVLAGVLELRGFGRPRDTDPRAGYLVLLGIGLVASVAVPLGAWKLLLPETSPAISWLAMATGAAVVVAVLGVAVT